MDAGCSRSRVQQSRPNHQNPPDNHKADQFNEHCLGQLSSSQRISAQPGSAKCRSAQRWLLWICIGISLADVSLAQTPHAKALDPVPGDDPVSIAELKIPSKAWSHLRAAHKAFRQGKLQEAESEADRALRIDPACAPAFSMKAFIDLASKNPVSAVEHATRAISVDPYSADSFVALAMAYNLAADFLGSQRAASDALNLRPNSWQARLELGKSLYGQNRFDAALRELNAVSKDFPDVHLVKGNVLMRLGRAQEGAAEFALFLAEAPHDSRVGAIRQIVERAQAPLSF